ncbi:hypothetical protein GUITHDRAFT_95055 [Guillardia theta CCMP2712]|uniref:F5/8 type C domain-containing protein n=1 Tax=Guillardia theta (strain CCMP2712) TaxID=905079 RepID=L1J7P4_GUITC|nr:hypothetical protein GUITHDRAFT_95055 [Guillardia theta CCMP2712]EKX44551.1 hypothetical protein GUITHDRAFT_95055 [Guillardia theta CCMP2712]|mmetsp:Transcript_917/g.2873  ORF Transcript_917/g.2873 Transcript_917/m.2873 type:complete len:139 (-) Transcript_917:1242-1658(-)|eukprot:XP_005831531.1 hypothetical protein GUITHDRAFT_95055 [Guillardia theta CCMP2712]
MADFGLASNGTTVMFSSCVDDRYPPENIIDGNDSTFWITTGLYPQQFILQFDGDIKIDRIKTITTDVRKLKLERCTEKAPTSFEEIHQVELAHKGGRVQVESSQISGSPTASFLRVTIESGWDDFAAVRRFTIEGSKA